MPEAAKELLARLQWQVNTKELASDVLASYYKYQGIPFAKPRYERVDKIPFIPLENEIDSLIGGCGPKVATVLQLLKETGARIGEAWMLSWKDLDLERGVATITPEKGSRARQFKLSPHLVSMLNRLPRKGVRVFGSASVERFRRNYDKSRRKLADKLGNSRLLRISFHTLRHWKATYEYNRTKDILFVQRLLGHRNIMNTMRYTQLVDWKSDDFICKTGTSVEDCSKLIESGFEYVTELAEVKLFRKRK